MNNIFNTSFEVSLRILIILNTVQTRLSIDRITALDFIAIYGKDFGVSEYNLHGDNDYRFSEYTSKREIVSQAIKELALKLFMLEEQIISLEEKLSTIRNNFLAVNMICMLIISTRRFQRTISYVINTLHFKK